MGGEAAYAALLEPLAIPPHAIAPLAAYLERLDTWARRVNLTGARTRAERVALLVRDVVPLAPELQPGALLDVGSGNGSPGLVLAALQPEIAVTLLEPRQRRWAFLREAARALGRPDIAVLRQRHDEYAGAPAHNVVVRALALPLSELAPLVAPGGRLIVLGRPAAGTAEGLEPARPLPGGGWTYRRTGRST